MPEMRFFNYAKAVGDAEQIKGARLKNQMMVYQNTEMGNILERRKRVRAIEKQYDDTIPRIDALREAGLHKEANELAKTHLSMMSSRIDIMQGQVNFLSEDNWKPWRQEQINGGADPTLMPREYDVNWGRDRVKDEKKSRTHFTRTYLGDDDVVMAQSVEQRGGEVVREGKPYPAAEGRGGRGRGDQGPKSADYNAIVNSANRLFKGLYNPQTQQFEVLRKDDAHKAQAIATEAQRLFESGEETNHGEAVTRAAALLGIDIPNLSQKGRDPFGIGTQP